MMRRTFPRFVEFAPIAMPALSPSMDVGTVVEWKKKVGDLVKEGDIFCTIQTDKAVVDYSNTFDPGYLAKIYCENGQSAPVAKTIGVMVDDAADLGKADEYVPENADGAEEAGGAPAAAAAAPAAAAPAAAATPAGGSSEPPADVEFAPIAMPALSPSMDVGTVVEWKKKVGDLVKEGDIFCTIQTDKAVVDYSNTFDPGYLAKIYCENGQSAPVAKTIGVMVTDAADIGKMANYYPEDAVGAPDAAAAPAAAAAAAPVAAPVAAPASSAKRYGGSLDEAVASSGPSVVRIAAGLASKVLEGITPTGKDGRFLKSDFSGQPGFDYNDAAPAGAVAKSAKSPSAAAATPVANAGGAGGVYDVVLTPGIVRKSVDDTKVLKRFMMAMPIPKAKKEAKN